jgi:replicative DNA helicase|tara:strand:- start:2712 stop:4214 length:1503 start_codon:yes stop_codon:yes gene_type:complete
MPIFSNQVERHVLSGLLRHPEVISEIDSFISAGDFYHDVHQTIFCIIRESVLSNEKIDNVLVSNKILNLGISSKDDIDIHEYITSLSYTPITKEAVIEASKELVKVRVRRELHDTADRIKSLTKSCSNENLDEIISKCDSIYGEKISTYSFDDNPENVFDELEFKVEDRGNNPKNDTGLSTGYSEFNRLYGGLRDGNVYAIVSRPAQGKTTFINDLCLGAAIKNKVPVLILDTEMTTEEIQFRMAAANTGVPLWYLETGNWRKNADMTQKIRAYFKELKKHQYFHYHVRNKNVDEVCSLIRRWHMQNVGRGNKCIIAYDYVKLTGERVDKNWAEHQAIGDKIDKLKRVSEEIQAPLITAMQMNRSGETHNRNSGSLVDDSSAISLSDRLQWFATFVAIFRRKTLDEIALDGDRFGTHKLIPLKTRFQGRDAAGHQDLMRRTVRETLNGREFTNEKFINNFINFRVENFKVNEEGSLADIIRHEEQDFNVQDGENNDDFAL